MIKTRTFIQDVAKAMNDELVGATLAQSTRGKTYVHESPDCEPLDSRIAKSLAEERPQEQRCQKQRNETTGGEDSS